MKQFMTTSVLLALVAVAQSAPMPIAIPIQQNVQSQYPSPNVFLPSYPSQLQPSSSVQFVQPAFTTQAPKSLEFTSALVPSLSTYEPTFRSLYAYNVASVPLNVSPYQAAVFTPASAVTPATGYLSPNQVAIYSATPMTQAAFPTTGYLSPNPMPVTEYATPITGNVSPMAWRSSVTTVNPVNSAAQPTNVNLNTYQTAFPAWSPFYNRGI